MSSFYDLSKTPRNILNQAIVRAIVSGNNGAWFDPEDLSTMFQDAAGTTPVTALEQPVGRWLDKSGNGNHATQSITASRPTLSARYNQLLNSATLSTQSVTTVAAQYTLSFTGAGSVTLSGTATGTLAGTGANNRVSLSFTPTAGTLTLTVTGSVTLAMLALGTLTTYQAITTGTSYDSVGWSRYVRFDAINDYLNLPYMGLYANGSASVILPMSSSGVAGVYSRIIAETSTVNAKARYIIPREDHNTTGTDLSIVVDDATDILSSVAVPFSKEVINVRSYVDSGDAIKTYSDSSEKQSVSYSRSGKTLTLNSTLIGAQATPTVVNAFAAIKLYGLIITKSALSDKDRRRCEQFLASRLSTLGVTLS